MKLRQSLLVAGAATTIGIASLASVAGAQGSTTSTPHETLIEKIATRFNLNKEEVQQVFEEEHAARVAEREQKVEDRLSQAVTNGKITEEQKTKILAKIEEMKTFMESLKDKSRQERRDAMDAKRDELEKWAEDNGIDTQYLRFLKDGHGHGHGHGRGHRMMKGVEMPESES